MKKLYTLLFSFLWLLGFSQSYSSLMNINWKIDKIEKNNTNYFPPLNNGYGIFNEGFDTFNNSNYFTLSSGLYNSVAGRITWRDNYFNIPAISFTLGIYEGENEQAVKFFDFLIYEFYTGNQNQQNTENYYFVYSESNGGKSLVISRSNGDKIFYSNKILSTSDVSKSKISIHPNPSSEYILIENLKLNSNIELYDNTGKLVKTISNNTSKQEINIKKLLPGIYYLRIDGKSVQKIIKK